MSSMEPLSADAYEALCRDAQILSRDSHGIKVLRLSDGTFLKLFRRKRLLSSWLLFPYAKRFVRASVRLKQLGIPTVEILAAYRIREARREAVRYAPLDGNDVRSLVNIPSSRDRILQQLATFLAQLHARGIYFRAIHFGNVILTPGDALGLIDISDARFSRGSLGPSARARNFRPLVKYREDRAALEQYGLQRFVLEYLDAASLGMKHRESFLAALSGTNTQFGPPAQGLRTP